VELLLSPLETTANVQRVVRKRLSEHRFVAVPTEDIAIVSAV